MDLLGTGLDREKELLDVQSEINKLEKKAKEVDESNLRYTTNLINMLKKQEWVYKVNQVSGKIAVGFTFAIVMLIMIIAMAKDRLVYDDISSAVIGAAAVMIGAKFLGGGIRGWVIWRTKTLTEKIAGLRRAT